MESIKIAGAGTVSSGIYDEVNLAGAAEVKGKIKCNLFKASGAISAVDTIECGIFKSAGTVRVNGDLLAEEIKISGASRIDGKMEAKTAVISGSIIVNSDINIDNLECRITNGSFENIYGDNVKINSEGNFLTVRINDIVKNIKVREIEATSICLKDVTADRVSGENICIEAGCKIKVVEYSKTLDISSKANIERIIKL